MKLGKIIIASIFTVLCIGLTGCDFNADTPYEREIFALDTFINLKIYGANGEENAELAEEKITELEALLSVTNPGSDISRINSHNSDITKVSVDTVNVIQAALDISQRTDGAFDISIYPVVKLWGFTTGENSVPSQSEINKALELVDFGKISVHNGTVSLEENMQIDLGAIAKGYIAQQVTELIKQNGTESAVLSFGGNIQTVGLKNGEKWKIGLKYPDTQDNYAILSVGEVSIVTSAADQRYFEENGVRYHHIIDPSTGCPAESGIESVTVVCDDGTKADGLSTALFVMGIEKASELYRCSNDFDFVILYDNTVYVTGGLADSIEFTEEYDYLNTEIIY